MPFVRVGRDGKPTKDPVPAPNYNPNDTLAEIIVDAWRSDDFKRRLLADPDGVFRTRGLYFFNPEVVEVEDYHAKDFPEGMALFVLPKQPPNLPPDRNLLDSARAAMAYTPVGI